MVYRDDKKVSDGEEEDDGSKSALIPKSLLSGKGVKPGDKIMLTVMHSYEDELEVSYSHSGKKDKDKNDSASENEDEPHRETPQDADLEELAADA